MDQAAATRTHLLTLRAQIRLAGQARDLLDDKRKQLLEEFRTVSEEALEASDALEGAASAAVGRLRWVEAVDGPEAVASAAIAASGEIFLEAGTVSIAGVRVPRIERVAVGRPRAARGYSAAGTSARIDAVADGFEAVLELIVHVAADELRLRRLAAEIGTTTRRVNALEHVLIPALEEGYRRVRGVLDEREREDNFRLRRVKTLLARPAVGQEVPA
ncbi:MAG TPA: V-type ATP synthase subunit D [Actinomycetota bacterium]